MPPRIFAAILLFFLATNVISTQTAHAAPDANAIDEKLNQLIELHKELSALDQKQPSQAVIFENKKIKIFELGYSIYKNFPDNPRHWEAAGIMGQYSPMFFSSVTPHGMGVLYSNKDDATSNRWKKRMEEIEKNAYNAKDIPSSAYFEIIKGHIKIYIRHTIAHRLPDLTAKARQARNALLEKAKTDVLALCARWPNEPAVDIVTLYLSKIGPQTLPEQIAALNPLKDTPNTSVRNHIQTQLNAIEAATGPADIKLLATDGSTIDTTTMGGKIVIIQQWSAFDKNETAHNVQEYYVNALSNIHDKYSKRGVIVIGVASGPRDKVLKYIKQNRIKWPQCIKDENEGAPCMKKYALHAFGTLIVGKDGQLVSASASASHIESIIRELLAN